MTNGRKVVHSISRVPPGGGSCHECARALYKSKGQYHYYLAVDNQGIERAYHHACSRGVGSIGSDHPVYDDEELYKADLVGRKRGNWIK